MRTVEEFSEPPVCITDPKRFDAGDHSARLACRRCGIRPYCARDAWETPDVEGLWAGVVVPPQEQVRGRMFALDQLKHIAEVNGVEVRMQVRRHRQAESQRLDREAQAS